jgi:adenosylhomocysteine nucleosidase
LTLDVVGIVCALAVEARHLGPATPRSDQLGALSDGSLLVVSGMGPAAAERGARALVDAGATALASWGLAGALDPTFTAGTIFLPEEVVGTDSSGFPTAKSWRERVGSAIRACDPVTHGKLLTTATVVGTAQQKATLFDDTGAAAVDMESLAVARVADLSRLPFIAVRVIVDGAEDSIPEAIALATDGSGHVQLWRLMGDLVRAPANFAPLMRLARRYRAANRSLAAVARAGISPCTRAS